MSKTVFGALPTPEDIRGARAWIGWTQGELGEHAGLSGTAIANIEKRRFNPTAANLQKIQQVFFDSDIEFLPGGGFKKRSDLVRVYEGDGSIINFMDDVYGVVKNSGGEILVSDVDEEIFDAELGEEATEMHVKRMQKLDDYDCRCLIRESDENPASVDYAEYRKVPDEIFSNVPFYIYGDKLAVILWKNPAKVIVMDDRDLTDAYRKQFDFIWQQAKKITN